MQSTIQLKNFYFLPIKSLDTAVKIFRIIYSGLLNDPVTVRPKKLQVRTPVLHFEFQQLYQRQENLSKEQSKSIIRLRLQISISGAFAF